MAVAFLAVPLLIEALGPERFGLLAIIWMGVGYFTLFDMGLGRALTRLIVERLSRKDTSDLGELIWTAGALIALIGAFGAVTLVATAGWLSDRVFSMAEALEAESTSALRVLAAGIPIVVLTSGLIGILEAHQRFAAIAKVRMLLGLLNFLGPLAVTFITPDLTAITSVLLLGRICAFIAFFMLAKGVCPELERPYTPRRRHVRPLIFFGGWLTVTNVVGPIMVYFDRFFIGSVLGMAAVAYYATPHEAISRLSLIPRAVIGVLFPSLTRAFVSDRRRLAELYGQSSFVLLLIMLPPVAAVFLLAPEGLTLWLGEDFRRESTVVVHWLAVGSIINLLGRAPLTLLQSSGRPDLTAKLHVAEVVPYLVLLWWLTAEYGIAGAAAAWALRILVDTVLLLVLASKTVQDVRSQVTRTLTGLPVLMGAFALAGMIEDVVMRLLMTLAVCVICTVLLWPKVSHLLRRRSYAA